MSNLNIQRLNLAFPRTPVRRSATRHIVLHHRAGTGDAQSIRNLHVNSNGWGWVGYHYYVRLDGSTFQLLDINVQGIHAGSARNQDAIAICFEGNYETIHTSMPQAQFNAGIALLRHVLEQFPNLPISGHNNHTATACPGRHFPLTRMVSDANRPTTSGVSHTVRAGETLWAIAQRHNTTVQAIQAANNMGNRTDIFPNQVLQIPVKAGAPRAGQRVQVSNAALFATATGAQVGTRSGTFYIWSADVQNGRVRVTNQANRVGVAGQVTGWMRVSDI